MPHRITASITFYFKGEKFHFTSEINLNAWMQEQQGDLEAIYDKIAAENGLDRYRHEYDVMVMEALEFSQPTGLAIDFFDGEAFDFEGFQAAWGNQPTLSVLQTIAQKHLDITSLDEHPKLKAALLEAYHTNKP